MNAAARPCPAPMRVLVAEDDVDFRDLLTGWLRQEGHDVMACSDGADLLRCLQMSILSGELPEFDVVISDVHMPLASAFDVLEEFLACDGLPPTLLITAFGGARAQEAARIVEAAGLLEKPFGREQLVVEIRRLCAARLGDPSTFVPGSIP